MVVNPDHNYFISLLTQGSLKGELSIHGSACFYAIKVSAEKGQLHGID
jgi:hypothetical protein